MTAFCDAEYLELQDFLAWSGMNRQMRVRREDRQMGKNLHYSILPFFKARMDKHSKVAQVTDISDEEDYVFFLERTGAMSGVKVHLSDAYLYTLMNFYSRPECIVATAREAKVGVGGIGKLMGALNRAQVWEYEPPDEERRTSASSNRTM